MVVGFQRELFEICDGVTRHAAHADEMDDEDCEEEHDAQDAERALPVFDDDAVKHGVLFYDGSRCCGGRDFLGFTELLEVGDKGNDLALGRHFGTGGFEICGE